MILRRTSWSLVLHGSVGVVAHIAISMYYVSDNTMLVVMLIRSAAAGVGDLRAGIHAQRQLFLRSVDLCKILRARGALSGKHRRHRHLQWPLPHCQTKSTYSRENVESRAHAGESQFCPRLICVAKVAIRMHVTSQLTIGGMTKPNSHYAPRRIFSLLALWIACISGYLAGLWGVVSAGGHRARCLLGAPMCRNGVLEEVSIFLGIPVDHSRVVNDAARNSGPLLHIWGQQILLWHSDCSSTLCHCCHT